MTNNKQKKLFSWGWAEWVAEGEGQGSGGQGSGHVELPLPAWHWLVATRWDQQVMTPSHLWRPLLVHAVVTEQRWLPATSQPRLIHALATSRCHSQHWSVVSGPHLWRPLLVQSLLLAACCLDRAEMTACHISATPWSRQGVTVNTDLWTVVLVDFCVPSRSAPLLWGGRQSLVHWQGSAVLE